MSTSLATTVHAPEPELPLLCHEVPPDPQTEVQRAVHANLQNEIDSVVNRIEDPQLRDVSETILVELVRFFGWLDRIDSTLFSAPAVYAALLLR